MDALRAFDAFEAMPAVIVPSHGPVGEGSLIAANRALMRDIQARVRELRHKASLSTRPRRSFRPSFRPSIPVGLARTVSL
jgi:hypothetical protein